MCQRHKNPCNFKAICYQWFLAISAGCMCRDPAVFRKFTFNRSAQEGETFPAVRKNHPIALSSNIDLGGLIIVPGMPTADHPKDLQRPRRLAATRGY